MDVLISKVVMLIIILEEKSIFTEENIIQYTCMHVRRRGETRMTQVDEMSLSKGCGKEGTGWYISLIGFSSKPKMWGLNSQLFQLAHHPNLCQTTTKLLLTHLSLSLYYFPLLFKIPIVKPFCKPKTTQIQTYFGPKSLSLSIQIFTEEEQLKGYKNMASANAFSTRSSKTRTWPRCSKQIREQRARLYIIWKCTVLLLFWDD